MNAGTVETVKKSGVRHVIRTLYDADADFNCFGRAPVGTYMLATLPRSGSTFCAIRLWQTGLLGAPMEYLNFRIMGDLFRRLGYNPGNEGHISSNQVGAYWSDVQRLRTSSNGMFAYKMFASNYHEISKKFPEFLQQITPNYVVYLTRRDEIGQAMSYSRAQRSKIWFAGGPNAPIVDYDYGHIKACLCSVKEQKSFWESVFDMTGTDPIRIYYEDLLIHESSTVESVFRAMGIQPNPESAIHVPMIMRQTDGISREWRERFLEDDHNDFETNPNA